MGFLGQFLKQTARTAAVLVPIKISIDYGVWSTNSGEGASLYSRLKSHVLPGTIVYKEELPSPAEATQSLVVGWNKMVKCTFSSVGSAAQSVRVKCHNVANQIDQHWVQKQWEGGAQ